MKSSCFSAEQFYRKLAPYYEQKVDWKNRRLTEKAFFDFLFSGRAIQSVCDLGCGDGGHITEILKRGAMATGIDKSAAMIQAAKRKFNNRRGARFVRSDILNLPRRYNLSFELVLLLGNTLPHLLRKHEIVKLFSNLSRISNGGAQIVIQTVNPGMLAKKQVHFLRTRMGKDRTLFLPLYVRNKNYWDFYLSIFTKSGNNIWQREELRTRLRFWSAAELERVAHSKRMRLMGKFGSVKLEPYRLTKSENMILIFEKVN